MKHAAWLTILLTLAGPASTASAHLIPRPFGLLRVNLCLHGKIVNYTANHLVDRRIWSEALHQKRDMYVYLPPGYDPCKRYPLAIYLHGFVSDEINFLELVAIPFDHAIAKGKLPPMIIAAPDATPKGTECFVNKGTFYINSKLGNFQDYLIHDIYEFMMSNYPIRPEPEAHVLLGASMGGAAAFCKVMRHRDKFGIATAFAPPLNPRWISCRGKYFDNFDPCCWGWRTDYSDRNDVYGKFCCGLIKIRQKTFIEPLFGRDNPDTAALIAADNPIELLDQLDIRPGFAEFYVAYGGKDEFNIDAQVESFLYRARQRGIEVGVDFDPKGHHSPGTALRMLPAMIEWLRPRLEPYRP
jgi:S-formylglutathione hydrolase FrmB